jgi:hypothetical protein
VGAGDNIVAAADERLPEVSTRPTRGRAPSVGGDAGDVPRVQRPAKGRDHVIEPGDIDRTGSWINTAMKLQDEHGIVRKVANQAAEKITNQTISALQKMKDSISGDDSELTNVWDHVCVQIQQGESFFWQAYEVTVKQHVIEYAKELEGFEKLALWLQTEEGFSWLYGEDKETKSYRAPPIDENEIVNYIFTSYIYRKADEWTNAKIQAYMESL